MTYIAVISPNRELFGKIRETLRKSNFFVFDIQHFQELLRFAKIQPIHFVIYDDASPIKLTDIQKRLNEVSSIDVPVIALAYTHSDLVDLYKFGVLNVLDISVTSETLETILLTYLKHMDIRLRYKVQNLARYDTQPYVSLNDGNTDRLVNQIPKIIREHIFTTPITIEFLANELSISRRHLLRKIYEKYNKTAIHLINEVKMSICHELLLERKHSIEEVSEMLGFKSQYYFKKKYENYLMNLVSKPIISNTIDVPN